MNLLEDYVRDNSITLENVRKIVDDYSLISYYIGEELELNTKYSSPLREGDLDPSFSIFFGYGDKGNSDKLFFNDQSLGVSGDVIDFLMRYLESPSMYEVLKQINHDLGLGLGNPEECSGLKPTILKKIPIAKERPKLAVVSQVPTEEYMNYWWQKYEITRKYTDMYRTSCVRDIHFMYSYETHIKVPRDLCIAYTIGKYIKIYRPNADKKDKFRNDYPNTYVEGHIQLDWTRNDLLVITKSMKECILFRQHWNIQAVAGKSESTMIPDFIMRQYLAHFKKIVIWLDFDETGIKFMEKYLHLYPKLTQAKVNQGITEKDPTDIFEAHRKQLTTDIVYSALNP